MEKFDPTKPVQLRSGYKARIYKVYDYEIHGAYFIGSCSYVSKWTLDGKLFGSDGCMFSDLDLVNIPEEHVVWIFSRPGTQTCYAGKEVYHQIFDHYSEARTNYDNLIANSHFTSKKMSITKVKIELGTLDKPYPCCEE